MKCPQLKRTILCHNKNKYLPEADRHDNWDDSGQRGKPYLFWIAGRVDRENLTLKMHLRWKMLRYLRRLNCTTWNQYLWSQFWNSPDETDARFSAQIFPLYSISCMAGLEWILCEAAPYQFQQFL